MCLLVDFIGEISGKFKLSSQYKSLNWNQANVSEFEDTMLHYSNFHSVLVLLFIIIIMKTSMKELNLIFCKNRDNIERKKRKKLI